MARAAPLVLVAPLLMTLLERRADVGADGGAEAHGDLVAVAPDGCRSGEVQVNLSSGAEFEVKLPVRRSPPQAARRQAHGRGPHGRRDARRDLHSSGTSAAS